MNKRLIVISGVVVSSFILILIVKYLNVPPDKLPPVVNYASLPEPVISVTHRRVLVNSMQIQPPVQCVPFNTVRGEIPICVHDNPNEYITNEIRSTGTWEERISQSVQDILIENPDFGIVDIGANLGMFSLLAANLRKPSLAVEAMDINIVKFHQSIVLNRFENLITLVTSPLSDKHETLQFVTGVSNLGMSRLVKAGQNLIGLDNYRYKTKHKMTLMLDELIDLMPCKKAIMVIDVEGNEGKIIRGGQKFFDAIFISHVFMEWNLLKSNDRTFLVDFFSKRGYVPYLTPSFKFDLDLSNNASWPPNVYWKMTRTIEF